MLSNYLLLLVTQAKLANCIIVLDVSILAEFDGA